MPTRRTALLMVSAALVGGAIGSFGALAQIRSGGQTPVRVGLKGYDPVAYFTLSAPTLGVAQYEYVYDGVLYRFANAHHRDLFKANPERYAPQFGGSCAMNMSSGVRREADPTIWVISNGNLYVFAGTGGQSRFREDTAAAGRASENWKTLKNTPSQ
jgi:YHS domain-containing protein